MHFLHNKTLRIWLTYFSLEITQLYTNHSSHNYKDSLITIQLLTTFWNWTYSNLYSILATFDKLDNKSITIMFTWNVHKNFMNMNHDLPIKVFFDPWKGYELLFYSSTFHGPHSGTFRLGTYHEIWQLVAKFVILWTLDRALSWGVFLQWYFDKCILLHKYDLSVYVPFNIS